MGKFKEKHGMTRVGAILRGVKDIAPDLIEGIGDITGIEALERVGEKLQGREDIPEQKKKMILELISLEVADKDSARKANVEILTSPHSGLFAKIVPLIIDLAVAVVWAIFTFYIANKLASGVEVDSSLYSMYTTVTAVFMIILQYYRGSSIGSKLKDVFKK